MDQSQGMGQDGAECSAREREVILFFLVSDLCFILATLSWMLLSGGMNGTLQTSLAYRKVSWPCDERNLRCQIPFLIVMNLNKTGLKALFLFVKKVKQMMEKTLSPR